MHYIRAVCQIVSEIPPYKMQPKYLDPYNVRNILSTILAKTYLLKKFRYLLYKITTKSCVHRSQHEKKTEFHNIATVT